MTFDILGARDAGYSEDEIAEFLAREQKFDFAAARESGYDSSEIIAHLSQKKPEGGLIRRAIADPAISLSKGVIVAGEAAIGVADLMTGGQVGRGAEAAGVRPKEAKAALDTLLSPEQQAANRRVDEVDGVFPTAGAMLQNPSTIVHPAIESIPSMLGGGAIGRAALKVAPTISPIIAGAIGEGTVSAGSTAEQIRQESKDGLLSPAQTALAAGSGAFTGLLGVAGGKVAQKLGIADIDSWLAGGATTEIRKGMAKRVIQGAISEGVLEEMPQSAQEQIAQNIALGKPWDEGVGKAAAQGGLIGGVMGGGTGIVSRQSPPKPDPIAPILDAPDVDSSIAAAEAALDTPIDIPPPVAEPLPAPQISEITPPVPEARSVDGLGITELSQAARLTRSEERRAEISAELERRAALVAGEPVSEPVTNVSPALTPELGTSVPTESLNAPAPTEPASQPLATAERTLDTPAPEAQAPSPALDVGTSTQVPTVVAKPQDLSTSTEVSQQPVAETAAIVAERATAPAISLKGMGAAISDNLYDGLFGALQRGDTRLAGVKDPVLTRARTAFDSGLIKSAADLRRFEANGYPEASVQSAPVNTETVQAAIADAKQPLADAKQEPGAQFDDYAAPKADKSRGILKGAVRTFKTEKMAALFIKSKQLRGYLPRSEGRGQWVVSKPAKVLTEAQKTPEAIHAAAVAAQAAQAAKKANRTIVRSTDSAFMVVQKAGGWNRDDAQADRVDPKDVKARPFLFRKNGGLSIDGIAEALDSNGFDVRDESGAIDATKAREIMEDSLYAPVYSHEGNELRAARDAEARAKYEARHGDIDREQTGYNSAAPDVQAAASRAVEDDPFAVTEAYEETAASEVISDEELAKWLAEGEEESTGGDPAGLEAGAAEASLDDRQANNRVAEPEAVDETQARGGSQPGVQSRASGAQSALSPDARSDRDQAKDQVTEPRESGVSASEYAPPRGTDGKRQFEYAMMLRPYSFATTPPGAVGHRKDSKWPHGVVSYDKPLSAKQIEQFDLDPLDPRDPINLRRTAEKLSEDLQEIFAKDDIVEGVWRGTKQSGPNGLRHVITYSVRPEDGGQFQVTSLSGEVPTGHRVYDEWSEAAGEFSRDAVKGLDEDYESVLAVAMDRAAKPEEYRAAETQVTQPRSGGVSTRTAADAPPAILKRITVPLERFHEGEGVKVEQVSAAEALAEIDSEISAFEKLRACVAA